MTFLRKSRKGFTLFETLIATVVALYLLTAVWGVYIMIWQWWKETLPRIETQRIARIAVALIVDGMPGEGLGTVTTANGPSYERRYGLSYAISEPDTATEHTVYFKLLDADDTVARGFKMGTENGVSAVYYKTASGAWAKIKATTGITDLVFEKGFDATGKVLVKITATAAKEVRGTRAAGYTITCSYADYVYLRNV